MGSNKSAPVSAPAAISADIKKWAMWIIIGFAIVFTLSYLVSTVHKNRDQKQPEKAATSSQSSVPLASEPVATWTKLTLPPLGKSEHIPIPSGMHAVMDGSRFVVHAVYLDGSECVRASEDAVQAECNDGQMTGAYVTNIAKETNIVSYAFAPK